VLVKVWRKNGQERWLLIHIEIQGWPEEEFAQRLFVYHYRIFDRYNRQVVTLVVLADDRPNWRPDRFVYDLWGCSMDFRFPSIKLLDFVGREAILEASENPFALLTRAHLATLQTRQDEASRHAWKVRLVRELYERGLSRDDVLQLFRIIDWMMDLPEALGALFDREVEQIEQERQMPYVTSTERRAEQKGKAEGKIEGRAEGQAEMLLRALERQFRVAVPEEVATRIRATTDPSMFQHWLDWVFETTSMEDFQRRMKP
jgi:hypothetical protein